MNDDPGVKFDGAVKSEDVDDDLQMQAAEILAQVALPIFYLPIVMHLTSASPKTSADCGIPRRSHRCRRGIHR